MLSRYLVALLLPPIGMDAYAASLIEFVRVNSSSPEGMFHTLIMQEQSSRKAEGGSGIFYWTPPRIFLSSDFKDNSYPDLHLTPTP